ncbi:MAG: DUF362 domain-containing protein [Bacteroidetes bacterium]|nr:DUF362 domain-containing protein [Bacteroidota bacterium]
MKPKFRIDLHKEKRWFISRRPSNKLFFILLGILATLWFIIRVLPKPSRASYPCMQVAAPFAASFIAYVSGLLISVTAYRKLRSLHHEWNFLGTAFTIVALSIGILLLTGGDNVSGRAGTTGILLDDPPNTPIGIARGIYPGRVAWVWNPGATDETCTNEPGDYWFQDDNVDTEVIENMLSKSLQLLSGEDDDSLAWDALFRHYNETHGNGNVAYTPGQKVTIKINLTTGGWGNVNLTTYEKTQLLEMMDGTPQLIVAMLKQLIDVFGVAQEDISIGDPIRHFYNQYWDRCHVLYPDVLYLDKLGYLGRTAVVTTPEPVLFYSDGTINDSLPTAFTEADYMINMGCLKQHDLAGGTFCAKNHFGSICRNWAMHLHYALPSPTPNGFENLGYGKYRNLVDLMEHKDLGEKTMLFLIDGIWGGELPVTEPVKWQIEPFNDDWPNSIFVSQDHVAIESVGIDFVRAQFDEYADMYGADDYLHQAADSANWADGIVYDPEADGVLIPSLGVHEHWNNDIDKEYTRNLGIGDGIELVKYLMTGIDDGQGYSNVEAMAYPNPFIEQINIEYVLYSGAKVRLSIHDLNGKKLASFASDHSSAGKFSFEWNGSAYKDGVYIYSLQIASETGIKQIQAKILKVSAY